MTQDIPALIEELVGQLRAYSKNQHHSFITTQQMAREAADALETMQARVAAVEEIHDDTLKHCAHLRGKLEAAEAKVATARNAALEEAAKIADRIHKLSSCTCRNTVADKIRALKEG